MTEIKIPGSPDAFTDVEADLIEKFENEFGELPIQDRGGFPALVGVSQSGAKARQPPL